MKKNNIEKLPFLDEEEEPQTDATFVSQPTNLPSWLFLTLLL